MIGINCTDRKKVRIIVWKTVRREWGFTLAANALHRWVWNKLLGGSKGGWYVFICCGVTMWQVKICPRFQILFPLCLDLHLDSVTSPFYSTSLQPTPSGSCHSLFCPPLSPSTIPLALADLIKGQARIIKSSALPLALGVARETQDKPTPHRQQQQRRESN